MPSKQILIRPIFGVHFTTENLQKEKDGEKGSYGKVHSAQTESHGYTDSSNCKTRNGE